MPIRWTLIVSSILACTAVTAHGQAAAPVTPLTGVDYAEIHELYARYNLGADSANGEIFAGVFTVDGEFVAGERVLKGRQAIAASRGPVSKERPLARHFTTSIILNATSEGVKGSAYLLLVNLQATPPVVAGGGIYEDVIVRTPEGWRFKKRTFISQTAPASTQPGAR